MSARKLTESDRSATIRHLRELIAALDHRAPHMERLGEDVIARDAADLKAKALRRLKELEDADAS